MRHKQNHWKDSRSMDIILRYLVWGDGEVSTEWVRPSEGFGEVARLHLHLVESLCVYRFDEESRRVP
jgi:hypothetical protein